MRRQKYLIRKALKAVLGEEEYKEFIKERPDLETRQSPSKRRKVDTTLAKPVSPKEVKDALKISRQKVTIPEGYDPLKHRHRFFVTECGREYRIGRCRKGHIVVKRLHCEFDGCPICGRMGSETHIDRMRGVRPRVLLMSNPYYFQVSFNQYGVNLLHIYDPNQFKVIKRRVKSWIHSRKIVKWIARWTFVNENDEFYPVLNIIMDVPDFLDPQTIEDGLRYAVSAALKKLLKNEVKVNLPLEEYALLINDIQYENVGKRIYENEFVDYSKLEDAIYRFTRPAISPEAYKKDKGIAVYIYGIKNTVGYRIPSDVKKRMYGIESEGGQDKYTRDVDFESIRKYISSREEALKDSNPVLYAILKKICPICGDRIHWAEIRKEFSLQEHVRFMKGRKIKAPTPGVFSGKDPVVEQCEVQESKECDFMVYHFDNDPCGDGWSEKVVSRVIVNKDKYERLQEIKKEIRKAIKAKFQEMKKQPEEYRSYFTDESREAELLQKWDYSANPFNNAVVNTWDRPNRDNVKIGLQVKKEVLKSMLTRWEWAKLWKAVYDMKNKKSRQWKSVEEMSQAEYLRLLGILKPNPRSYRGVRLEDMLIYAL